MWGGTRYHLSEKHRCKTKNLFLLVLSHPNQPCHSKGNYHLHANIGWRLPFDICPLPSQQDVGLAFIETSTRRLDGTVWAGRYGQYRISVGLLSALVELYKSCRSPCTRHDKGSCNVAAVWWRSRHYVCRTTAPRNKGKMDIVAVAVKELYGVLTKRWAEWVRTDKWHQRAWWHRVRPGREASVDGTRGSKNNVGQPRWISQWVMQRQFSAARSLYKNARTHLYAMLVSFF